MSGAAPETHAARDHFSRLVADWSHFGPPLRPTPSDTALLNRICTELPAAPRAVVLGLTPETVGCRWPAGTWLLALDHDPTMVARLWPNPDAPDGSVVALASWLAMPLADACVDIVCADGCHIPQSFPAGFMALAREVARVLRPGGRFVARVFTRPPSPEPLAQIARDLAGGAIGSVHALKLRLLAALHGQGGAGSGLDAVWRAWRKLPPVPPGMRGQPGWAPAELHGIEAYAGLATRYYLPTLQELRAAHQSVLGDAVCHHGSYELAAQCPTLVWRKP